MQIETTPEFLRSQGLSLSFAKRFWAKVDKNGPVPQHLPKLGPCWVWTASLDTHGYGHIFARPKILILAHRASWILHFGSIPVGLCVCHHCDTKICVNPVHLFPGTKLDNSRDMEAKGRARHPIEEAHGRAKLTSSDVLEILKMLQLGKFQKDVASDFGISQGHVHRIAHGLAWWRLTR